MQSKKTADLPPISLYSDKAIYDEFMRRHQDRRVREMEREEMTKKEAKHLGQQQLPDLTEYDLTQEDCPRGMPPLADVIKETQKLGLPDSDAEYIYDSWLANGFKNGRGLKIASWKAAVRIWNVNRFFPSLKKAKPKPGELMTNAILDALAANPAYKKLDVQGEAWKFKAWCKEREHQPLVTSFVKWLNRML
jgi:hypothetical protein